ncbi:2-hydroxyacid dehydrogenase [Alphaproteobacteria bacterium GH1-50]|uniref:2-hydroxyacid dehydrogenase n=1 Tax=Kangsaoukella pontilimi TaxID=2691042 RepID=A0A7C9IRN5_9RHOB|nr:2-hydroxyacid dehydrogenase [Kangsaoukella pontilimi]MXQ07125.1 2-hydroxyacid dehydrogenase [Kangsaoukella pontilimi]
MSRPDILQLGPYPDWDQTPLDAAFTMHRLDLAEDADTFLAEVGPRIRGIATKGDVGASRRIIAACPALEVIAVYGVGFDAVDIETCRARGIAVTNTPDVLTGDVADFAVAMTLALSRELVANDAWVRSGDWSRKGAPPLGRRVWGQRAGILGLGRIGEAVARRLAAFDMTIAYSARSPKATPSDWRYIPDPVALAEASDILILTLAVSGETRHIVDEKVLDALGPNGMLVNVARAAAVDEDALIRALAEGRLGGAALDVFEGEPDLDPRIPDLPNVLLQPHQASATMRTRKEMGQLMRDNLTAHFEGRPLLTPVP